jgi:ABC-2 type transport system permease protein
MPILDQGYQHWNGKLAGHALRWLTITRQGVRAQLKNRWVLLTLFGALLPALVLSAFLIVWGLFEQQSAILTPFLFLFQNLPDDLKAGPKGYRSTFWTLAYSQFFEVQIFVCMILTVLVGPDLISQDLRFNALPLYFSRPLRRIDYFLGKFGVIAAFLLMVTLAPALLAYVVGLAFSLDPMMVRDTWRVLAASIAFSLVATVSTGLLMLAFSSLSRSSRQVAAMWIGLWMVGGVAAGSLQHSRSYREWSPLVSYTRNLSRVSDALFDVDREWERLTELFRAGKSTLDSASRFGPLGMGRVSHSRRGPFAPPTPPAPPQPPGESGGGSSTRDQSPLPWTWSAGVLAGLGAASIVVLSTRVRSLDRLK